jgi:hypothetical protein
VRNLYENLRAELDSALELEKAECSEVSVREVEEQWAVETKRAEA